jgi:hypothetical protein
LHSEPSLLAVLRAKDNANARRGALKYPAKRRWCIAHATRIKRKIDQLAKSLGSGYSISKRPAAQGRLTTQIPNRRYFAGGLYYPRTSKPMVL